jgi:hypothetical protein
MTYIVLNSHDEPVDNNGRCRAELSERADYSWRVYGYESLKAAQEMAHKFTTKNRESHAVAHITCRYVYQPTVVFQDLTQ